jgi:hypothetical protein
MDSQRPGWFNVIAGFPRLERGHDPHSRRHDRSPGAREAHQLKHELDGVGDAAASAAVHLEAVRERALHDQRDRHHSEHKNGVHKNAARLKCVKDTHLISSPLVVGAAFAA